MTPDRYRIAHDRYGLGWARGGVTEHGEIECCFPESHSARVFEGRWFWVRAQDVYRLDSKPLR